MHFPPRLQLTRSRRGIIHPPPNLLRDPKNLAQGEIRTPRVDDGLLVEKNPKKRRSAYFPPPYYLSDMDIFSRLQLRRSRRDHPPPPPPPRSKHLCPRGDSHAAGGRRPHLRLKHKPVLQTIVCESIGPAPCAGRRSVHPLRRRR